jgi:anti-sigma factor ChrR (cupin superfamily)
MFTWEENRSVLLKPIAPCQYFGERRHKSIQIIIFVEDVYKSDT